MVKKGKMNRGFTLLELITVVVIIGFLATMAFPHFARVIERGRQAEAISLASAFYNSQQRYRLEWGGWAANQNLLDVEVQAADIQFFTVSAVNGANPCFIRLNRNNVRRGSWAAYGVCVDTDGTVNYAAAYSRTQAPGLPMK